MKICPKCNWSAMIDTDMFCYRDGEKLVENKTHSCGKALSHHDVFCPKCGVNLEREAMRKSNDNAYSSFLERESGCCE